MKFHHADAFTFCHLPSAFCLLLINKFKEKLKILLENRSLIMTLQTPPWLKLAITFIVLTILYIGFSLIALKINNTYQKPQVLPVIARIQVSKQIVYLEAPQTAEQQAKGLMYRTAVSRSRGILFEIEPPQIVELSMQNILVPLDTIFLKDGEIQSIRVSLPPCSDEVCPIYSSDTPVDRVIQLRAQRTLELGLKIGSYLPIEFLDPNTKVFR